MNLIESARNVLVVEASGLTTIRFVSTGKHQMKATPAKELVKTVKDSEVEQTVDNMTDPYFGYEVASKRPATPEEADAYRSDQERHGASMHRQAGPRPGSRYRGD